MPNRTVFVVDDDVAVRNGLRFLLHTAGYRADVFPTAPAFLDAYEPSRGGCLVLDVQMPSMNGLELQQELSRRGWRIPVIFITGHGTIPLAIEAIKAGASEFIEKPLREDVVLECIHRVLTSRDAAGEERRLRAQLQMRAVTLTPREREVLSLVGSGDPCKLIARQLGISFRTVEGHRAHIMEKLGARGPSDLVRFASIIRSTHIPG